MTALMRPDPKDKPSYLKEMLTHQYSLYGFLGAITAGAALSMVSGGLALVPLVGFAAGETIASLFIPGSAWWRQKVDAKYRKGHREKVRAYLVGEIEKRVHRHVKNWSTYDRLRGRVASLETTAQDKLTQISTADVEALDDATVNYLSLWLGTLVMAERAQSMGDRDLDLRIDKLKGDLDSGKYDGADQRRLEKALRDLQRVKDRRASLGTRQAAAQSAMLSLADSIEEVYQSIMANPTASDVKQQLTDAISRMQIEEDVEHELDTELNELFEQLEQEQQQAQPVPAKG